MDTWRTAIVDAGPDHIRVRGHDVLELMREATFTDLIIIPMNHQFNASVTKTTARHTLKFGMDYRKLMINFLQLGQPSGEYNFDTRWTQLDPNNASATAGFGMA